jgi:hypothetical protein
MLWPAMQTASTVSSMLYRDRPVDIFLLCYYQAHLHQAFFIGTMLFYPAFDVGVTATRLANAKAWRPRRDGYLPHLPHLFYLATTSASHCSHEKIDQYGWRDEKPGLQGYGERADIAKRRRDHRGGAARSEPQLYW